jgi:S-DNA-T family DNA segregation ATPase FtsK/SpoIIIE
LIIATQRPSVNIITGTIKANFPARIAFRVTSKIDSRTILDSGGADQLIGRGDMLLSTGNDLIRIQCAFVDTPEVEKITDFIGNQRGYPDALILPEVPTEEGEGGGDMDDGDRDSMFEEAARMVVQTQQGSTSLIQRKLKLGYNRAGRIVDQLEAAGILGGFEGSKARRVLIPNEAAWKKCCTRQVHRQARAWAGSDRFPATGPLSPADVLSGHPTALPCALPCPCCRPRSSC